MNIATWHNVCYKIIIRIAYIRCLIRRPWASFYKIRKEVNMARTVKQFISAITGRLVKEEYAETHPETTVSRTVKVGPVKHRK